MIAITTSSMNGCGNWYQAQAEVAGCRYESVMATRTAALMDIVRQLARSKDT